MNVLNINNISFSYYNRPVIDSLSLAVQGGEMVGLLGPNGSGKTTLIKIISGILKPKDGNVTLDRENLKFFTRKQVARKVAVLPQQFSLPYAFSVEQVVWLGRTPFSHWFNGNSPADRVAARQAITFTGIENLLGRYFSELSGGEQQKVVLAMALAQQPELLLLDEPTVHLDINHQIEILELVRKLNKNYGLTVIAAMHDLNLAAAYFKRLIMLKDGKIAADGIPVTVLTENKIADLFGAVVEVGVDPLSGCPHVILRTQHFTSTQTH